MGTGPATVLALSSIPHGPVVLVLHVIGNDPCSLRVAELLALMRANLDWFPQFFVEVVIVWHPMVHGMLLK